MTTWTELKAKLLVPIDCFGDTRIFHCLLNRNISFVGQLYLESRDSILNFPNFGRKSLGIVDSYLQSHGLKTIHEQVNPWGIRHKAGYLRTGDFQFKTCSLLSEKERFSEFLEQNKKYFEVFAAPELDITPELPDPLEGLSGEFKQTVLSNPKVRQAMRDVIHEMRLTNDKGPN